MNSSPDYIQNQVTFYRFQLFYLTLLTFLLLWTENYILENRKQLKNESNDYITLNFILQKITEDFHNYLGHI